MAPVPFTTIVSASMGTFFTPLMLERLYAMLGDVSTTDIVTVARPLPPRPLATTVSNVDAYVANGMPEMAPLERFKDNPAGNVLPPLSA